jgi:hypothetical protein
MVAGPRPFLLLRNAIRIEARAVVFDAQLDSHLRPVKREGNARDIDVLCGIACPPSLPHLGATVARKLCRILRVGASSET